MIHKSLLISGPATINCLRPIQVFGWYLSLELFVFCFVLAYRESEFQLYRETRSELIPYLFALDHIDYAQCLPVHLRNMLALEQKHLDVYTEYSRSFFPSVILKKHYL